MSSTSAPSPSQSFRRVGPAFPPADPVVRSDSMVPGPAHIAPRYLTEADYPWLRLLCDEYDRFAGRRRAELVDRMREPLGMRCDPAKLRVAKAVLERAWSARVASVVPPAQVRASLFRAAVKAQVPEEAVHIAASELGLTASDIFESLFADLPSEQRLRPPTEPLAPAEIALRGNLLIVQRLLMRAAHVELRVRGGSRAIVRQAQLRGLLCVAQGRAADDSVLLEISGPLAIFHRTLLYGRALGSLIPGLAWCRSFTLRAYCHSRDALEVRLALLTVQSGDPIFPASEPRAFDSKLERQFARAFARAAPDWEIVREPAPLDAAGTLIFPDFELRHRRDRNRRWLLEIAGFWTPDYLERKLARLRVARVERFILCIDEERAGTHSHLPEGATLVLYRRRIDPAAVLAIVCQAT